MWNKVLRAKYGYALDADIQILNKGKCSNLWSSIIGFSKEPNRETLLSKDNLRWTLRDDNEALFWEDWWGEEGLLKNKIQKII